MKNQQQIFEAIDLGLRKLGMVIDADRCGIRDDCSIDSYRCGAKLKRRGFVFNVEIHYFQNTIMMYGSTTPLKIKNLEDVEKAMLKLKSSRLL